MQPKSAKKSSPPSPVSSRPLVIGLVAVVIVIVILLIWYLLSRSSKSPENPSRNINTITSATLSGTVSANIERVYKSITDDVASAKLTGDDYILDASGSLSHANISHISGVPIITTKNFWEKMSSRKEKSRVLVFFVDKYRIVETSLIPSRRFFQYGMALAMKTGTKSDVVISYCTRELRLKDDTFCQGYAKSLAANDSKICRELTKTVGIKNDPTTIGLITLRCNLTIDLVYDKNANYDPGGGPLPKNPKDLRAYQEQYMFEIHLYKLMAGKESLPDFANAMQTFDTVARRWYPIGAFYRSLLKQS